MDDDRIIIGIANYLRDGDGEREIANFQPTSSFFFFWELSSISLKDVEFFEATWL